MANKNAGALKPLSLAWLRRDLRLHDHAVLHSALAQSGQIQPVFIFDTDILARFPNPQDRRLTFIAHTLERMHRELHKQGGGLLVLHGSAAATMPKLAACLQVQQVICAEDFEPSAIMRDRAVAAQLPLMQVVDHLIHHPSRTIKDDGTPYRVFTPYSKTWRAALKPDSFAEKKVSLQGRLADYNAVAALVDAAGITRLSCDAGAGAMLEAIGYQNAGLGEWQPDDVTKRLEQFVLQRLDGYKDHRDFMSEEGTSKLSPYLRFGLISVRECARLAAERHGKGSDSWINELIWREFYAMILYHFPDVVTQEFQPQYRELNWQNSRVLLEAFCNGQTGYPIVDAAMRQLLETGWMHNRARMIVASFMTKDLRLDWRLGEEHFAQHLMDYDLASNNGGWQWAASVGTDAQPYFRVFNPELQSRKFDPKGDYIRRYVPELSHLDKNEIHAPKQDLFGGSRYPRPIVDHRLAKELAISMFKERKAS